MVSAQRTRCPHCHTTFRVSPQQLEAASGTVRCGKCYKAFNGFDALQAVPAAAVSAAAPPAAKAPPPTAGGYDDDDFLIDDDFDLSRLEVATAGAAAMPTTPAAKRNEEHSRPAGPSPPPVPVGTAATLRPARAAAETPPPSTKKTAPGAEDVVYTAGSPIPEATQPLAGLALVAARYGTGRGN